MRARLTFLAAALGACVPEAGVAPCTVDGECLDGHECYESVCLPCETPGCNAMASREMGPAGGRVCSPDGACVQIFPQALSTTITVVVKRSTNPDPEIDRRSLAFDVLPLTTRLAIPARITVPISPSLRLADVHLYVASGYLKNYVALPGTATATLAVGTSDHFGVFVAGRAPP